MMSFRKKTRPIIAIASLSRSRQVKLDESDGNERGKAEDIPSINSKNNIITTCDPCRDMPGTKEGGVGKDLNNHPGEVIFPKISDSIQRTDSKGSDQSTHGPLKTIQSKRFKRFRPSLLAYDADNSRTNQLAFKEAGESALTLKEDSSAHYGGELKQNHSVDMKYGHPTIERDESLDCRLTAKSDCPNDCPILVDKPSESSSDTQSLQMNINTEQAHGVECSLPSIPSCPTTIQADSTENQIGFVETGSSITKKESNAKEVKHRDIVAIGKESENDIRPIAGPSTELNDKNPKIVSPSNWTKKRKIAPCLSRAGRKLNSTIGAKYEKSSEVHENVKMGFGNLEEVCVDKEDIASRPLHTEKELCHKNSRISEENAESLQEDSSPLLESVANTIPSLRVSGNVQCKSKDKLLTKSGKEDPYVDATKTDLDSSSTNVTNLDVSIENNDREVRQFDNSEVEVKKSKRVRFKPNIITKCSRPSPKKSGSSNSFKEELNTSAERLNKETGPQALENVDVEHQQTQFTQQDTQDDALMTECGKTESPSPIENNQKEASLHKSSHNATHPGIYSDTEDGSQSEGEGIQHHNKRKFIPYLGPKVRQRRRLSSVTLFEDDGHLSDKNQQDSNPEKTTDRETLDGLEQNNTNADNASPSKKQKRKRIVIKEPKEKMTMFDYIYFNPKSSEEKEGEKDNEKRQQKRSYEGSAETSKSEIVLGSIRGEDSNSCTSLDLHEAETQEDKEIGENEIIAPQIKIGEDGQIVIDEESLVLKTTRSKMSLETSEIVYTDDFDPYQRKQGPKKKKRWTIEETLKFYSVLSRIGTDFSLMMKYFPDCQRSVLKKKFKNEEKFNGDLIDRALKNMLPMNDALVEELKNATDLARSRKLSASSNADSKCTVLQQRNVTSKLASGQKPLTSANMKQSSLAREEAIVQEEIFTMEVAENVTI